jgi:hypothetical protein
MRTKFWLESLKGRDHSEDLGIDGRINRFEGCELDSYGSG